MTIKVLNPSSEVDVDVETVSLAQRLDTLSETTVGIISNGKEGTKGYFDHLTRMLYQELGVSDVVLMVKANYSAPAEQSIIAQASTWDFAITGIGD